MANKYQPIMDQSGARFSQGYQPSALVSMTDEQLDEIELQLKHALPTDYREFLRDYGGTILPASFPVQEEAESRDEGIFCFYGEPPARLDIPTHYHEGIRNYDPDSDVVKYYPSLSLVRSMEGVEEIGWPEELLPIGNSGGGDEICLALFGLHPGAVFYWRNAPFSNAQNVYLVANSFDEFLHLLRNDR